MSQWKLASSSPSPCSLYLGLSPPEGHCHLPGGLSGTHGCIWLLPHLRATRPGEALLGCPHQPFLHRPCCHTPPPHCFESFITDLPDSISPRHILSKMQAYMSFPCTKLFQSALLSLHHRPSFLLGFFCFLNMSWLCLGTSCS